jgi:hypothetical protein
VFPTSLAVHHDFHLADPKRLAPDRVKTLAAQPINVASAHPAMVLTLQGPPLGIVVRCWFEGALRRVPLAHAVRPDVEQRRARLFA